MTQDDAARSQLNHSALRLHVAETFWSRLLGLHAIAQLRGDEALLLRPCKAIHTCFMRNRIDVVFLDAAWCLCRCIHSLPPLRIAWHPRAHMVVELPAGYCRRHPDYLVHIHAALRLRVCPRLLA